MTRLLSLFVPTRKLERSQFLLPALLAILIGAASATAIAQEQDRSDFGPQNYLERLDENQNGMIDPSEKSGRTRRFLERLGFDTEQPIDIQQIVQKLQERRRGRNSYSNNSSGGQAPRAAKKKKLKVPGFGPSENGRPVPGFGTSTVDPIIATYSDDVWAQTDDVLNRYDQNRNGILDPEEIRQGRWGNPPPLENDTNGDGRLSRNELAGRYYAREQYRRQSNWSTNGDSGRESNRSSNRSATSNRSTRFRSSGSSTGSTGSNRSNRSNRSESERYQRYASQLIKNYDQDGDGKLNKQEIKRMRRPPTGADQDQDGFVTVAELVDSMNPDANDKASSQGSPTRATTFRKSGRARAGSNTGSSSLGGLDKDSNHQIEMHEFSSTWDDETLARFYEIDTNQDGVITPAEWNKRK